MGRVARDIFERQRIADITVTRREGFPVELQIIPTQKDRPRRPGEPQGQPGAPTKSERDRQRQHHQEICRPHQHRHRHGKACRDRPGPMIARAEAEIARGTHPRQCERVTHRLGNYEQKHRAQQQGGAPQHRPRTRQPQAPPRRHGEKASSQHTEQADGHRRLIQADELRDECEMQWQADRIGRRHQTELRPIGKTERLISDRRPARLAQSGYRCRRAPDLPFQQQPGLVQIARRVRSARVRRAMCADKPQMARRKQHDTPQKNPAHREAGA